MAIKSVYDRSFTLQGWFGTTQNLEMWFDREWVTLAAGGTQFNQAIDGTMTSAGALVNQGGKVLAGTLTSSATLLRQAGKVVAGTLTTAGALLKLTKIGRAHV